MSSPMRNTESSRAISSVMASRKATRYSLSSAIEPGAVLELGAVLPFAGVHVLVELLGLRVRALVGELDDVLDLAVHRNPNVLEVLLVRQLGLLQFGLERDDRIGLAVLLLLFVGAVLVGVDHGATLEAVAHRLDESRLGVGARLLDDLGRGQHHLDQVHAVELERLTVGGAC